METVSEVIRALRACGLSQTEIARKTGIPQPRISKWANGAPSTAANDALKLVRLHKAVQSAVGVTVGAANAVQEGAHVAN